MKFKLEYLLGGFGLFCLLLAFIFFNSSSKQQSIDLPGNGGTLGPIVVTEKNTVYSITVRNYVPVNRWSNISIDVLDNQKQFLFNFSDGMWHETGYDSDGKWVDSKSKFTMDITFKETGQYYLNIEAERNDGAGRNINISIAEKAGSHLPFLILGVITIVCGVILFYIYKMADPITGEPLVQPKNIKKSITFGIIGILALFFIIALFASTRGYGYMGYYGYYHGPSFFYWGGPRVYRSPSHRTGSVGGSGHRGGGLRGGK